MGLKRLNVINCNQQIFLGIKCKKTELEFDKMVVLKVILPI